MGGGRDAFYFYMWSLGPLRLLVCVVWFWFNFKIDEQNVAEMPKSGANFIKRFDRGLAVNAFELNLKFKKDFALV